MSGAVRHFVSTSSGVGEMARALTVVTYNLLAPKYATAGMHSNCPAQFLDIAYRGPRIIQELLGYDADILCLQEVERPFFEGELEPALGSHGYEALYYGRAVRPTDFIKGPEEGIALAYRSARFAHVTSSIVRLGDLVGQDCKGEFWGRVRNLQEGAIWAVLHDNQLRLPLLVGCTHLFWDPRWPDAKVAQAALLCRAAHELLRRAGMPAVQSLVSRAPGAQKAVGLATPAIPVLLGGDFNSLPYKLASDQFDAVPPGSKLVSGVYQLLSEGSLGPDHPDHPAARRPRDQGDLGQVTFNTCGLRLRSALAAAWGCDPPVTNKTPSFGGCLDYLWASPQHWEVAQALEPPYSWEKGRVVDPKEVQDLPPIPNESFPSDHLSVGARLVLTSQRA